MHSNLILNDVMVMMSWSGCHGHDRQKPEANENKKQQHVISREQLPKTSGSQKLIVNSICFFLHLPFKNFMSRK
jgi:hypothetical protein